MGLRDQIFATVDDRKSETVAVPEWGDMRLVIRELSVRDRNVYVNDGLERIEVAGGFALAPKMNPLRAIRLVVLSTFDEDGNRVFEDGDVERLGERASAVIDRLFTVAARLSGIGDDEDSVEDEGKD